MFGIILHQLEFTLTYFLELIHTQIGSFKTNDIIKGKKGNLILNSLEIYAGFYCDLLSISVPNFKGSNF